MKQIEEVEEIDMMMSAVENTTEDADDVETENEEEVENTTEDADDVETEEEVQQEEEVVENTTEEDTASASSAPKTISWKLDRKTSTVSIFNKKKMRERAPYLKVLGFVEAEMGITFQGNSRYDGLPKEIKTELDMVKNFKEQYSSSQDFFSVAHIQAKHKWGRTIPAKYNSLSVFHRPTRHALCEGIYCDKDMANCHPQLIAEIAENLIEGGLPKLKKYNAYYKQYRQLIAEHHGLDINNPDHKNIAKQLPIRLVYGGSYDQWIKDNNILVNADRKYPKMVAMEKELAMVRELVWTNNQDIYKDVIKQDPKKWKDQASAKRGVQGLWCQTIERLIMEDCCTYLVEEKGFVLEDIVPSQDGLMILKELNYEGIEEELAIRVWDSFGVNIKWDDKAFDEAIEIPEYSLPIHSYEEWMDLVAPKPMAERLKVLVGKKVLHNYEENKLYVYYDSRWYEESELKKAHRLRRIISEDLYENTMTEMLASHNLKGDQKDLLAKIIRSTTSKASMYGDIISQFLSIAYPATADQFDNNPYLLGFENGKIDLRTGEFSEYTFEDHITLTTLYNYRKPDYDTEEDEAMKQTLIEIFNGIQPELDRQTLLIQILASGLDGNNYQAMWYLNGRGGNGKGLIGRLMPKILGSNFYLTPKNSLLAENKSSGASPDIADLIHKRYICFKEMGGTIHLPALRVLTGGDDVRGRFLHQNNINIQIKATVSGEFNNPPDYDQAPQDADYRRGRDIKFDNNYTTDPLKIGKTIDGIFYREANTYYETQEFVDKARDVFLDMLINCYAQTYDEDIKKIKFLIPESVWRSTKNLIDGTNKFSQWWGKHFEESESRKVDFVIKKKVYDAEKKKEKTVSEEPARMKVGDAWEVISNSKEYQTGARTKANEFVRHWGKKEFFRWVRTTLEVKETSKYEYVLGWKKFGDAEITWETKTAVNGDTITTGWSYDEEDEDDDLA